MLNSDFGACADVLYVSNIHNNTIERFSSLGVDLGVFASASNGLSGPNGIAFDGGLQKVVDVHRVLLDVDFRSQISDLEV